MPTIKFVLLLLLPFSMVSQQITGKIYDAQTTVKGATIFNTTKNIITHSDDRGAFNIKANVADTIIFHSLFHRQQTLKLKKEHFNEIMVIELKKTLNNLDEVIIRNDPKAKEFEVESHNENFQTQIKNDIKENPHLYQAPPRPGGIDFIKLASLIGKLFKNKKVKKEPIVTINYKQFDSLFSNDTFFTRKLLTTELKIPKEFQPLYFDYCDGQGINTKLLSKENRFLLLDKLNNCTGEFLIIISDYNKGKLRD